MPKTPKQIRPHRSGTGLPPPKISDDLKIYIIKDKHILTKYIEMITPIIKTSLVYMESKLLPKNTTIFARIFNNIIIKKPYQYCILKINNEYVRIVTRLFVVVIKSFTLEEIQRFLPAMFAFLGYTNKKDNDIEVNYIVSKYLPHFSSKFTI